MNSEIELLTRKLTPKMRGFAECYVLHLNATRAAGECGCTGKNLQEIGSSLKNHPLVDKYIQYLRRQQLDKMGVSKDRVLLELCRMAYVDIGDIYDEHGCVRNVRDMPEDVRRAIGSITTQEMFETERGKKKYIGDSKTIKMTPKEKALEMLCRHLGMFQLDNQQQRDVNIVVNSDESSVIWQKLLDEY